MLAKKCKGCILGRRNDTSYIIRQKQKIWHQVLKRVSCRGTTMSVEIPISAYTESKKLLLEKEEGYRRKVEIRAVGIEEAVIQRVIKNKEIQSKLINIVEKLKGKRELDIYTDGSLVVEHEGNREGKKMGIGWIVAGNDSNKNSISFKSRIADWPSSTRAELDVIWTALLAAPSESKVRIYSDSNVAIEGIQGFKSRMNIRNMFKTKNRSLINQITDCCRTKNIDLKLIKVKSHSMNYWNDKADKLEKEGLIFDLLLEVQDVTTSSIRVVLTWRNKLIDSSLRTFINITTVISYECEWANLSNIKPLLGQRSNLQSNRELNWRNTWSTLKKLQGKRCNSIKKSKALIFRIKCLNKLLPTKDLCFQRNPSLYKSKTCVACFAKEESLEHIAKCQIYQRI